jgi:Na+-driven multidrug efflux pump
MKLISKFKGIALSMFKVAWPSLCLTLIQGFVSAAEISFASVLGKNILAGVGVVYPFFLLMQTISIGGFGGTVTAAVAKSVASKNQDLLTKTVISSLLISLFIGVICSIFFILFGEYFLLKIITNVEIVSLALVYGRWLIGFSPVFWLANCLISILRGFGLVRQTLIIAIIAYISQLLIVSILISTETITSIVVLPVLSIITVLGMIIVMLIFLSKLLAFKALTVTFSSIKPILLTFIYVGIYASASSLVNGLCSSLLSSFAAKINPEVLAAYSVVLRIEVILMLLISGIGVSIVTGTASALGRKDLNTAWDVSLVGILVATVVIGILGFIVSSKSLQIFQIISLPNDVFKFSQKYLSIVSWSYPFMAIGFSSLFVGQGFGRPKLFFYGTLFRLGLIAIFGLLIIDIQSLAILVAASYMALGVLTIIILRFEFRQTTGAT